MNDDEGIARARWSVERRAECMIEGGEGMYLSSMELRMVWW